MFNPFTAWTDHNLNIIAEGASVGFKVLEEASRPNKWILRKVLRTAFIGNQSRA